MPLPGELDESDDEVEEGGSDGDAPLPGELDEEESEEGEEQQKPQQGKRGRQQQQQPAARPSKQGRQKQLQQEEEGEVEEEEEEEEEEQQQQQRQGTTTKRRKGVDGSPFFDAAPADTRYSAASFADLSLSRPLVKACQALGYTHPTPIQVRWPAWERPGPRVGLPRVPARCFGGEEEGDSPPCLCDFRVAVLAAAGGAHAPCPHCAGCMLALCLPSRLLASRWR